MLELFLKLIYIDPLKVNNQMQESRGAPAKKPAPDYFLWGLKFYILREFACMGKPRFFRYMVMISPYKKNWL